MQVGHFCCDSSFEKENVLAIFIFANAVLLTIDVHNEDVGYDKDLTFAGT